jgi:hypothetical protein
MKKHLDRALLPLLHVRGGCFIQEMFGTSFFPGELFSESGFLDNLVDMRIYIIQGLCTERERRSGLHDLGFTNRRFPPVAMTRRILHTR